MTLFQESILNKLLDKYENSVLSKTGSVKDIKIKITTTDPTMKTYHTRDSFKYRETNDKDILELKRFGYIDAYFESNGDFSYLTLNIENVDKVYEILNRTNPKEETKEIKDYLSCYNPLNFMINFKNYILNEIDKKCVYPKTYFTSPLELKTLVLIIEEMIKLKEETMKRDFSVRVLNDSKRFLDYETRVISIIKDFDPLMNEIEREDILAEYNIVSNYSYTLIKNKLKFKLGATIIDLNEFNYEFSLSNEMIKDMEILDSDIKTIITVENLTSFYAFEENALIIYLAGFHNTIKTMFLKKLYKKFPNAKYYHFSDIDCGGFYIFKNLVKKTDISFIPYKMGIEELNNYSSNLKDLSENDKKKLKLMLVNNEYSMFHETIKYMLKINKKLEQEILD